MNPRPQTPMPAARPMPPGAPRHADDDGHDDPHPSLLDGFHWPPTVEERRALRHAAEELVGPGGA